MELQRGPNFSFPACKPGSLMPQVNPRHDLEVWSCFIQVWVVAGDMSGARVPESSPVIFTSPVSLIGGIIKSSYYTN